MGVASELRAPARLTDSLAMARPSHWVKHVFIVPGVVLALLLRPQSWSEVVVRVLLGFLSAALVALVTLLALALALLTWLDIPALERLSDPHYIETGRGRPTPR